MNRLAALRPVLGLALSIAALGSAAHAQDGPPLTAPELAAQRGGLMTPMGIDIGFGAVVSTYVDGKLALQTQLTWTNAGAVTQQSGPLAGSGGAAGPAGGWSAVLPGLTGGATNILHDLSADRIASVIVNSASNRNLQQVTNVTLTLPQLPDLQRQFAQQRSIANLQGMLGVALQGSGSH